jgi:hypothetical protein
VSCEVHWVILMVHCVILMSRQKALAQFLFDASTLPYTLKYLNRICHSTQDNAVLGQAGIKLSACLSIILCDIVHSTMASAAQNT